MKDAVSGRYGGLGTRSLVILLAGVLYFVVPLDAVPDFLFGWGLLDDAAVMSYVFATLADELAAYQQWSESADEVRMGDDKPGKTQVISK